MGCVPLLPTHFINSHGFCFLRVSGTCSLLSSLTDAGPGLCYFPAAPNGPVQGPPRPIPLCSTAKCSGGWFYSSSQTFSDRQGHMLSPPPPRINSWHSRPFLTGANLDFPVSVPIPSLKQTRQTVLITEKRSEVFGMTQSNSKSVKCKVGNLSSAATWMPLI